MRRFLATLLTALALAAPLRATDDPLARFAVVAIKPATTSIIIASVTMTMPPFTRKRAVYSSTYSAKVFPYFFYSEKGRIWIQIQDEDLLRAERGLPVDFKGQAINEAGEKRRIEGHAVPTGPTTGKIRVRVFVTRRISLNYDTTYELRGAAAPVTPK